MVEFRFDHEPDDYSFIWFLGILAVVLFIVFFLRMRFRPEATKRFFEDEET